MAMYQRGSLGNEVRRIQERLKALGLYGGPLDASFGGGTEGAVRQFQQQRALPVTGVVDDATWARLFGPGGGGAPAPAILQKPLDFRVLALTGSFETNTPIPECFCGLSGDFDGQGVSVGALQWNLGQQSLQPLLKQMLQRHGAVMEQVFHVNLPVLEAMLGSTAVDQLAWSRSIQSPQHQVFEPWRGMFRTLGRTLEFQDIQRATAGALYKQARQLAKSYDLTSERAIALMFDILVQNGGIKPLTEAQIRQDFLGISPGSDWATNEVARMRIVGGRRAEAANPQWQNDVRSRKLTIANGAGVVHGRQYDLAQMYGIRLAPAA